LTKKEFYALLQKEASVILSQRQVELFDTFLDPLGRCVNHPKTKLDLTKVVELTEKQTTMSAVRTTKFLQV